MDKTSQSNNGFEFSETDQKLKQDYDKQVELMASKSRFGYFGIAPSYRAGITDYAQKKVDYFKLCRLIKMMMDGL